MELAIPAFVRAVLDKLCDAGHGAFLVGGCVRDSLLGRSPQDWDITTSAAPAQTISILEESFRVLPTGLRHGTVTALSEGEAVEVTTFRVDGPYSDGRRPDSVRFTGSLREDLSRRDFTVNAMAYHPQSGLADPFGGADDLSAQLLRCVGEPRKRFSEDALRILRGVRFASVLGFAVEERTAAAMAEQRMLLSAVAPERLANELLGALCGEHFTDSFLRFWPVITQVLPELAPCVGFEQHTPYHCYNVYEHCVRAAAASPRDPALRLAMLLHDCAKPQCATKGIDERLHFYGHQQRGAELAAQACARLRLDNDTAARVRFLVERHDIDMEPERRAVTRLLARFGESGVRELLSVHRADNAAQSRFADRHETFDAVEEVLELVLEERACFSLHDLAVDGHDLIAAGIPKGPSLGAVLRGLLELVVEEKCPNEKPALLQAALKNQGGSLL